MKRYLILAASVSVLGISSAHAQAFPSLDYDNSAQITQTGNANDARIDQAVGGQFNGQASAEIIQSSNRGIAEINQITTAGTSVSAGFDNTAKITQRRLDDIARIDQIHVYGSSGGNDATIFQATRDAEALVQQRGDKNLVVLNQRGLGSVAPYANVQQNGVSNIARVAQTGQNGLVVVYQGNYSTSPATSPETQFSRALVNNAGSNADIFVSQVGFRQFADIDEAGANGTITVSMAGTLNDAYVTQNSTNGEVQITSEAGSFSNLARVTQNLSDTDSSASILQTGSFAEAVIEQSNGSIGSGNSASVVQTGTGTVASISSLVFQDGMSNEAMVTQAGAYALSDIMQTGVGHSATVSQ